MKKDWKCIIVLIDSYETAIGGFYAEGIYKEISGS